MLSMAQKHLYGQCNLSNQHQIHVEKHKNIKANDIEQIQNNIYKLIIEDS